MYSIPFTLVLIKLWSFVSYYDFLKKKKKRPEAITVCQSQNFEACEYFSQFHSNLRDG